MGKNIKKRPGFFKLFHHYNNNELYEQRLNELEKDEEFKLEKGDGKALFLAGFLTIFLPCILIIGLTLLIACLIFGVFW